MGILNIQSKTKMGDVHIVGPKKPEICSLIARKDTNFVPPQTKIGYFVSLLSDRVQISRFLSLFSRLCRLLYSVIYAVGDEFFRRGSATMQILQEVDLLELAPSFQNNSRVHELQRYILRNAHLLKQLEYKRLESSSSIAESGLSFQSCLEGIGQTDIFSECIIIKNLLCGFLLHLMRTDFINFQRKALL